MDKKAITRYRVVQFLQLLIAIGCCIWIFQSLLQLKTSGQGLIHYQSEQLARSLSSIATLNIHNTLSQPEELHSEQLQSLVDELQQQRYVSLAAVFDRQGKLLVSSGHSEQDSPMRLFNALERPFITEVSDSEQGLRAYLKIQLNYQSILSKAERYIEQGQSQMMLIMLVSMAIGFLLTRVLSRKRYSATLAAIALRARAARARRARALIEDVATRTESPDSQEK